MRQTVHRDQFNNVVCKIYEDLLSEIHFNIHSPKGLVMMSC